MDETVAPRLADSPQRAMAADLPSLDWGVAMKARPGETACREAAVVRPIDHGLFAAVVHGLGDGAEAATAAAAARVVLEECADDKDCDDALQRCHEALRDTCGAVVSVLSISTTAGFAAWVGVGNVKGRIIPGTPYGVQAEDVLPLHAGIAGHDLPDLRVTTRRLRHGDIVLVTTDGLATSPEPVDIVGTAQDIAARMVERHTGVAADDTGALVLAIRYL